MRLKAPPVFGEAAISTRGWSEGDRSQETHFAECVDVETAQNYIGEWTRLASTALERNVFFEPSFVLSATLHVSGAAAPSFLLVWESGATELRERLIGVWPLVLPSTVFSSVVKTWRHDFACPGAPLLDETQATLGLELMFKWLTDHYPYVHTLYGPLLSKAGPIFYLLQDYARAHRLSAIILEQYDRAALDATILGFSAHEFVSSKKRKELRRQFRRLSETGSVSFGMTQEGKALHDQTEAFMALEAKGWKGRQGGAFLNDSRRATFLRAMTRTMEREGKCRIYWLAVDGRMIAGNIVLLAGGDTAYFWKTAYDEEFAFASPGLLLTMDMTDRLLREPRILTADSCAIPRHPMIDHVWRGRLCIADMMMSLREDRTRAFNGALQRERFRRRLRDMVKSALAYFRSA